MNSADTAPALRVLRIAVALVPMLLAVVDTRSARADWLFGGYLGASGTSANDTAYP